MFIPEESLPIIGLVLFLAVIIGFTFTARLYKILKESHPEKYKAMGEPTLFLNNSPKTSIALMKFLFKREYIALNNPKLTTLGNIMLVFFVIYLVGFILLASSVIYTILLSRY